MTSEITGRREYGYDLAGNRTFAWVKQYPTDDDGDPLTPATAHVNDRSWLYAYDRLNRLSDAMMGQLTEDNQGIAYGQGIPAPTRTTWNLDNLGNWSGGGAFDSVKVEFDANADEVDLLSRHLHHQVNQANEITSVQEYLEGESPQPGPKPMTYDPAGNLVYDGTYYYQYDP